MNQSLTAPPSENIATARSAPPGWVRFFDLEAGFQLFLLAEMAVSPTATGVFDNKLFVSADLVNKHKAYDVAWDAPSTIAGDDLHRWYPLERLSAHCLPHLLAAELADHPSTAALFNGKVHVRKKLIEPYTSGDTDWLDFWPDPVPKSQCVRRRHIISHIYQCVNPRHFPFFADSVPFLWEGIVKEWKIHNLIGCRRRGRCEAIAKYAARLRS